LKQKVAAPFWKTEEHGHKDPLCSPFNTLYPQKLALTSPTSGGCSVSIVRSWTKVTEFFFFDRSLAIIRFPFFHSFCSVPELVNDSGILHFIQKVTS
jgi:hypothetical protein